MQEGGMRRGRLPWLAGIILGFGGALLDFYSGYLLVTQSGSADEMGMIVGSSSSALAWGIGIIALGVVLAVTSFDLLLPSRAMKMMDFGALMVVYGLAMLFIGGSMYSGVTSLMGGNLLPAIGMLAVGVLMLANGALMLRGRSGRFSPDATDGKDG